VRMKVYETFKVVISVKPLICQMQLVILTVSVFKYTLGMFCRPLRVMRVKLGTFFSWGKASTLNSEGVLLILDCKSKCPELRYSYFFLVFSGEFSDSNRNYAT
jgi:hypothetical protein